jgi:hypothetical protein
MRDLKLKHYFLFFLSFLVLWLAEIPAGSIVMILLWQQMAIYLWSRELTKQTQLSCLLYSIGLLPLFFFLGATSSFMLIYLKETHWLPLFFAFVLNFIIVYLLIILSISFFLDLKAETSIQHLLTQMIRQLRQRKTYFLKLAIVFLIALIFLKNMTTDYALVAAYVITHIMARKVLIEQAI